MAKNQTKDLIAELTRNLESSRSSPILEISHSPADSAVEGENLSEVSAKASQAGKGVRHSAFLLFDEDRILLHEISMHLYSQGIKPTNNLILRAAIRLLPETSVLADTVRQLIAADGRTTRHK